MLSTLGWPVGLSVGQYLDDVNRSEKTLPLWVAPFSWLGILGCRREREPTLACPNSLFSTLDWGYNVISCFRFLLP